MPKKPNMPMSSNNMPHNMPDPESMRKAMNDMMKPKPTKKGK